MIAVNDYIGLPYSECDCYELVRRAGKLYGHAYPAVEDYVLKPHVAIGGQLADWRWKPLAEPEPGCVVLLRHGKHPRHVGLYVGAGDVLHAHRKMGSVVETLKALEGYYVLEGFYAWSAEQ